MSMPINRRDLRFRQRFALHQGLRQVAPPGHQPGGLAIGDVVAGAEMPDARIAPAASNSAACATSSTVTGESDRLLAACTGLPREGLEPGLENPDRMLSEHLRQPQDRGWQLNSTIACSTASFWTP